ncbi:MAG: hypothetical protein G01um101456_666 [Parcubacteria group bacterium Gr01-1014_56]|nr:MAG: hypothetical protein G01um101456_666 [Parcubacteria group bacterium Gr01-1014_56]
MRQNIKTTTIRPTGNRKVPAGIETKVLVRLFLWVLTLHLGFAFLIVYHDYIGGDWLSAVRSAFQGKLPDSYFNFVYWFYLYIPVLCFLYGLFELTPLSSIYRNRKSLAGATIRFHSMSLLKNLVVGLLMCTVLLATAWFMVLTMDGDHFGEQIFFLLFWMAFLKIGPVIGPQ